MLNQRVLNAWQLVESGDFVHVLPIWLVAGDVIQLLCVNPITYTDGVHLNTHSVSFSRLGLCGLHACRSTVRQYHGHTPCVIATSVATGKSNIPDVANCARSVGAAGSVTDPRDSVDGVLLRDVGVEVKVGVNLVVVSDHAHSDAVLMDVQSLDNATDKHQLAHEVCPLYTGRRVHQEDQIHLAVCKRIKIT